MTTSGRNSLPSIGFLTVIEHAEVGLTGGYLVLNTLGRPLEFHCTAPVKTNRTQEILYGPTLKQFVYGEQIGQTLWEKSQLEPLFICTDIEPVLAMREVITTPVACVLSEPNHPHFVASSHLLRISSRHTDDQQYITDALTSNSVDLNLLEPFERIRDAISEAQKAA